MTLAAEPTSERSLRIGELAREVGTTARTIRYYEEIGLLPGAGERQPGRHRTYTTADAQRLTELLRLKDLLGVSLEELKELVEAEEARTARRAEWQRSPDEPRRRQILDEALAHIDRQRELIRNRRARLDELDAELRERHERVGSLLAELDA